MYYTYKMTGLRIKR